MGWIVRFQKWLGALFLASISAIVTIMWPDIRDWLRPPTHVYTATFTNGRVLLQNTPVTISSEKSGKGNYSLTTDIRARLTIALPKGDYRGQVNYNGTAYPFTFSIDKADLTDQVDIGSSTAMVHGAGDSIGAPPGAPPGLPEAPSKFSPAADKSPEQLAPLNPSQMDVGQGSVPSPTQTGIPPADPGQMSPATRSFPETGTAAATLSAAQVLNDVQVHVRRDPGDLYGQQTAYHYYLTGSKASLDAIQTAYYKRNHNTFDEYPGAGAKQSTDRSSNFDFKAYQWGSIRSAYLSVTLHSGETSPRVLKTLNYDN
ncbi:hypothetical protein V9K67_03340 [Paraflavisolibacter sp. H34]|uniref:hypothetical protein n=1 Tax=Huijunlia imazamoxiresistens TaxID=3127457 RepID=UPI00301A51F2